MSELRIGLVGCGRLAERGYVEGLRRARGVRLAALADPEERRCRQLTAGRVPVHSGIGDLVAGEEVDGIVLATPAAAHLAGARVACGAGLPALVEKPPAATAEEAAEIARLDPPPAFGFNRRFEPGMERLRRRIPTSDGLELQIDQHYRAGSWRPHLVDDDALLALGPHVVDLARWLAGSEVEGVRALELRPRAASIDLALSRGRATVRCSTDQLARDLIEVREGGRVRARRSGGGVASRGMRRLRRPLGAGALVRSLALQLEDFARAARGQRSERLATAADGLAVMRVLDAAARSAASSGAWLEVGDSDSRG